MSTIGKLFTQMSEKLRTGILSRGIGSNAKDVEISNLCRIWPQQEIGVDVAVSDFTTYRLKYRDWTMTAEDLISELSKIPPNAKLQYVVDDCGRQPYMVFRLDGTKNSTVP